MTSYSIVVPMLNELKHLTLTVPPLLAEAAGHPGTEVVFVDNGSTDGGPDYLAKFPAIRCLSLPGATIGEVRNYGAQATTGAVLIFIDADCVMLPGYLDALDEVRARTGARITGSSYRLPAQPSWVEHAWHALHWSSGEERPVALIGAANLVVERLLFEQLGGFSATAVTGEDAELCGRARAAGAAVLEAPTLGVQHLGNPKTVAHFFRQQRWHGLGALRSRTPGEIDRPLAMTLLAGFSWIAATGLLTLALLRGDLSLVLGGLALALVAPAAAAAYRAGRGGAHAALLPGILLYTVYFGARLNALALELSGSGSSAAARRLRLRNTSG